MLSVFFVVFDSLAAFASEDLIKSLNGSKNVVTKSDSFFRIKFIPLKSISVVLDSVKVGESYSVIIWSHFFPAFLSYGMTVPDSDSTGGVSGGQPKVSC